MTPLRPTLAALLALAAGCGEEGAVRAKEAIDASAEAARKVVDELAELDLSALSPEALKAAAVDAFAWTVARLEEVRDSETARRVAAELEPVMEQLTALARRAAEELPERAELRQRVAALRARYGAESGVGQVLGDLLERLERALE